MENKDFVLDVPGKFSVTEEAILIYLCEHPNESIGTRDLIEKLKPEDSTADKQRQTFDEIQYGIETLVAARLVRGKRLSASGKVQYVQVRLTPEGEAEALTQQRRVKKIILPHVLGPRARDRVISN